MEETTKGAAGRPLALKHKIIEGAASATQGFDPVKSICGHLNAFHVYTSDPSRCVEANHYCTHLNEDLRQCLIYDTPDADARLIGVEYMITPVLYNSLPASERKLWHSHVYEVKSGMLIMPKPPAVPVSIWDVAETKEMEEVIPYYGKTFHFWQVDRGDRVPMGGAELMGSFTGEEQVKQFEEMLKDRNERFGVDMEEKRKMREGIVAAEVHEDADQMWKDNTGKSA